MYIFNTALTLLRLLVVNGNIGNIIIIINSRGIKYKIYKLSSFIVVFQSRKVV